MPFKSQAQRRKFAELLVAGAAPADRELAISIGTMKVVTTGFVR